MRANETTVLFDLGTLEYDGDSSDSYSVTFDDKSLDFAKISLSQDTYSLLIDLSELEANATIKSDTEYEIKGSAQITTSANGSTRTEDLSLKFKLTIEEAKIEEDEAK